MIKINNIEVITNNRYAYDGCHKIYILEDDEDLRDALDKGYRIRNIDNLEEDYINSCDLKFISNWKLDKHYVRQFEECVFEKEDKNE